MEAENRTEGDLTRLSGTGEAESEEGAADHVKAQSEEGAVREARGAGLSNAKRRELRSIVNRAVHKFPGGEEGLFEQIGSGVKVSELIGALGVSEGAFYSWAETTPERSEEFARARARAAHVLAEQGLAIVDGADAVTANLANVRARYRQWLAGKWNQQAYGENKAQVNVQVNITDAHLMANRYRETVNAVNVDDNTIDVAPHNE